MIVLLLFFLIALVEPSHAQNTVVIDLGLQGSGTVTLSARPNETYSVKILNQIPGQPYSVSLLTEIIGIEPLPEPNEKIEVASSSNNPCQEPLRQARTLRAQTAESAVALIVREVRATLDEGTPCRNPEELYEILGLLAATEYTVASTFSVGLGEQVTITVSRSRPSDTTTRTWRTVLRGASRGTWITMFGTSIVKNNDELFFSKAGEDGKFIITPQRGQHDLKIIPSVYFAWVPRAAQLKNWSFGPTAGFGLSNAAVFAGGAATYNQNLGFIFGASVYQQQRLSGQYVAGQILSESLSEDQLARKVLRAGWTFGITWRFGSNPFSSGNSEGSGTPTNVGAGNGGSQ